MRPEPGVVVFVRFGEGEERHYHFPLDLEKNQYVVFGIGVDSNGAARFVGVVGYEKWRADHPEYKDPIHYGRLESGRYIFPLGEVEK